MKAFSKPEDEILLYQADGAVEGWLHYYHSSNCRNPAPFAQASASRFSAGKPTNQSQPGYRCASLTRFLNEGKRQGAKDLVFFVGTDDEMNRIMPELGFRLVGRYLGYQKKI